MKLIIDMDEDVRVAITRIGLLRISDEMQKKVDKAIQRGIPLPKGYGRLIDADDIDNHIIGSVDTRCCPTIIEANKTEREDEE